MIDSDSKANLNYGLTDRERQLVSILLLEPDVGLRSTMRAALVSLGYEDIVDAGDYASALAKLEDRSFTHLIFDTRDLHLNAREFLSLVLHKAENLIVIPASSDPTVDEVFDLLIGGARSYLAKPCTAGTLEEAIVWATKGESISEAVLRASTRNEALAMLVLSALSKLALVMRQARNFDTAKREVPRKWAILNRAMEIARTFCKGGDPKLREAIIHAALLRAEGHAASKGPSPKRRSRRRASSQDINVSVVTR